MAEKKTTKKEEEKQEKKDAFDYEHTASFKLSDKFKSRFGTQIKGKDTLTADGLIALGHVKGIWKLDCDVIQFPNQQNGNMCICRAILGGYDWDPITKETIRVEYSDIGDASPSNCGKMVAPSFIRMASTRAIGRVLRKYLNLDMLCTEELGDDDISTEAMNDVAMMQHVGTDQLVEMKKIINAKNISQDVFTDMLTKTFNVQNYQELTFEQANTMINILNNYIPPKE